MKKRNVVLSIVGSVLALLVVAVLVAWAMIDSLAKQAVQEGGQYALGVPTKVNSVNLSLLGGSLQMETLGVGNPAGYSSPHLMRAGRFHLALSPGSVFSDTVVVPVFELDGLDVNIEPKTLTNNIAVVLDHLKKLGGESSAAHQPQAPAPKEKPSGKKVRVDKVVIRNVVAHVILPIPAVKPLVVKVPAIELNNVSSDSGISIDQLIGRLVPAVLASILESGKGIIPQDLLASLNTDLANTVNAIGGQAAQLVQQGASQASAQVQQAAKVVPAEARKEVGQVSRQAQGTLNQVQQAAAGQLQQAVPAAAASQPAGQAPAKALEGLFKKK
jgi:hypothetical protein